jgi:hypothetical protein
MRYFTLFSKKKLAKIFPKKLRKFQTIFKNQYFLDNTNHLLAILREEASDRLLQVQKV